ncbi:chemotaxis protein [Orenia metallireducens]|uniref:Chemotaxis protein n=1 Tax=Orenia metallireducens TaxID=1413210 RepID=A0A1C0AAL7_9FIRM|nr:HAMP domain-containing methyl-accepting chemotaxis protein [Orenia metallireducens]OCL27299.1 chemotaxis protein [Orenia metallireducens]
MNIFIKDKMSIFVDFLNRIIRISSVKDKFNNLKFRYKLLIGFSAVILVFLLGSMINLLFLNSINDDTTVVKESGDNMYYVLKLATLIRAKYIDAVDLSNNNDKAIHRFEKHEREFQKIAGELTEIITDKRPKMLLIELIKQNNEFNRIFTEELIPVYNIKNGRDVPEYNGIVNFQVPMIAIINTRDDLIYASNVLNKIFTDRRIKAVNDLGEHIKSSYTSSIISVVFTIIVSLLIVTILENNLVKTLQKLVDYSRELASGNLKVEKLKINTGDQIEELARSFNTMIDNLYDLLTNISDTSNQVAGFSQELSSLSLEADSTIHSASSIISDMSEGVKQVSNSSHEVMELSYNVVDITKSGYNKIKASIEQITKIQKTVDNVAQVIDRFNQKSNKIGKITDLIDRIADQTNLLALNASIEAARAGEAGKGFAVVADEIRNLSKETSEATKNIDNLIREIQKQSKEAINAIQKGKDESQIGERVIKEAGESFDGVNAAITDTVANIEETTASTEQLAAGSQEVLKVTEEVKAISKEVTMEAEKLSVMADNLNSLLHNFNL